MTRKPAPTKRPYKRSLAALAPRLDKRLLAYTAAASAAGVGLLSPSAEAKIIYTAANIPIVLGGATVQVDLNHDGVTDFGFYNFFDQGLKHPEGAFASGLGVGGYPGNGAWTVDSNGFPCAAVLPKGVQVGPGAAFQQEVDMVFGSGSYSRQGTHHCKWANAHHGAFVGLKFQISGQTHYGWAHVTVSDSTGEINAVLNGYAYETVANQPITTGKTFGPAEVGLSAPESFPASQRASLGLLARGSHGLTIWRRPEEQEAAAIL